MGTKVFRNGHSGVENGYESGLKADRSGISQLASG